MTTAGTPSTENSEKEFFLWKVHKSSIKLLLEPATCKIGMQLCDKNKEVKLTISESVCPQKIIIFVK